MRSYVVMLNLDGDGVTWTRYAGAAATEPDAHYPKLRRVPASSPGGAIDAVRDAEPGLKAPENRKVQYAADLNFNPQRMRLQLIESYRLAPAHEGDDTPAQTEMETGP